MHAAGFFGKPAEMDSVCSFGSVVRLNYRLQLFFLGFFSSQAPRTHLEEENRTKETHGTQKGHVK